MNAKLEQKSAQPAPRRYNLFYQSCASLVCVAFVTACGSHPYAPAYPTDDPFFSEPQPIKLPGLSEDVAPPGRIMPGDVLNVEVMSAETTTYEELVVDGTGHVHLPLVGDVDVGGLSLSEAEEAVKEAMKRFDSLAEVAVIMVRPEGHVVTVLGAVPERGRIALPPGVRLADVLALAGGPLMSGEGEGSIRPLADLEGARLQRNGTILPVSFPRAIEGDPAHNVYVHPGDHIYVPPLSGQGIRVLGEVGSRIVEYRPGLTLSEALALSGGVTRGADRNDIRVVRGPLSAPRVYEASLARLVNGKGHDVQLAPGDIVYVTDHWTADLTEWLARIAPVLGLATSAVFMYLSIQNLRFMRRQFGTPAD